MTYLRFCLVMLVTLMPASPSIAAPVPHASGAAPGLSEQEDLILNRVNSIRTGNGLTPLVPSRELSRVARSHSVDMAKRGVLDHRGGDGRQLDQRIASIPVPEWRAVGENVGYSFGNRNNAETIVAGWKQSPPHLGNILSRDFDSTGIGVAYANDGTLYATQVFMGSVTINRRPPGGTAGSAHRKTTGAQKGR